ncbi:MAG: helix-turn-helix domain-containing protein [bacterium]
MKQKDLARRLGIGQNLLSEFENGIRVILPPGVENKILKIFPELKNSERKIIESDK